MASGNFKIFSYFTQILNSAMARKARREMNVQGIEPTNIPLLAHIQQLRSHIVRCLLWLCVFSLLFFAFMKPILIYLKQPYETFLNSNLQSGAAQNLTALNIFEVMTVNFKICFYLGFALSLPFLIYELWKFVAPALYQKEKKLARLILLASLFLFYLGIAFGYYLIIPYFFQSALAWASQYAQVMISYESYFNTLTTMVIIFAIIFEVPVILSLLGLAGILPSGVLAKNRRIAFLACFILGAILAPPDVVSLCLVAIPMYLMVEVSIYVLKKIEKAKATS